MLREIRLIGQNEHSRCRSTAPRTFSLMLNRARRLSTMPPFKEAAVDTIKWLTSNYAKKVYGDRPVPDDCALTSASILVRLNLPLASRAFATTSILGR